MTGGKVNILDLFSKSVPAGSASVNGVTTSDSSVITLEENVVAELPESPNGEFVFSVSEKSTGEELPSFMSETSIISLLPSGATGGLSTHRLVAAGGQYLCLARGESLWVIDMTTGLSNDRQINTNTRPITDLEMNGSTSLLAFTDGIDVGILKCLGVNGSHIQLSGSVYLVGVGTRDDPVKSVMWHPSNGPSFVTVRAVAGWTLWDLVRLQSKTAQAENVPALFRSAALVENIHNLSEGTFSWVSASNTLAGKKLSPGVLAILKRGSTDPSPERSSSCSDSRKKEFRGFELATDGSRAVAVVGDGVKVWTIGLKCSTVTFSGDKGVEAAFAKAVTEPVTAVARSLGSAFFFASHTRVVEMNMADGSVLRSIRFESGFRIETFSGFTYIPTSISGAAPRQSALLIAGHLASDPSTTRLTMIGSDFAAALPCSELSAVGSLVIVPTVGNSKQLAVYAQGTKEANLIWCATTIDTTLLGPAEEVEDALFEPEISGASPLACDMVVDEDEAEEELEDEEAFDHSDVMSDSPPERLESRVDLVSRSRTGEDSPRQSDWRRDRDAADQRNAEVAAMKREVVLEMQEAMLGSIASVVAGLERDAADWAKKSAKEWQSSAEREIRKSEDAIAATVRKVLKEQFASGMKSLMDEIAVRVENAVVKRVDSAMSGFVEKVRQRAESDEAEMSNAISALINRVDAELAKPVSVPGMSQPMIAGPPEPPALTEIRRFINAGDHLGAISAGAQWWRLNQPVSQDEPDLLAITCAAIAPQIRAGEAMRDVGLGCYLLLILSEWTKVHSTPLMHADRTVAVLRAANYVISCLFASTITVTGESADLCYKSLSKSVRNTAAVAGGTGDRMLDELAGGVLNDLRELMMKFAPSSREATPRASPVPTNAQPGNAILQLLQGRNSRV